MIYEVRRFLKQAGSKLHENKRKKNIVIWVLFLVKLYQMPEMQTDVALECVGRVLPNSERGKSRLEHLFKSGACRRNAEVRHSYFVRRVKKSNRKTRGSES